MALIPIERARRYAIEHLRRALIVNLGAKIASEATDAGLAFNPVPDARWIMGTPPRSAEDMNTNAPVWVAIYNTGGTSPSDGERTEVGDIYAMEVQSNIQVELVFGVVNMPLPSGWTRADGTSPTDEEERQTMSDLMQLRADVYGGALVHTLMKYGIGGDAITDIQYVSDDTSWLETKDGLFGIAEVVVQVTQDCAFPTATPLT